MCGEELHLPGLQGKQQAGSKAGFVKTIPDNQIEEPDVGHHYILHEHLESAPG
jgi:hypothetical protein